MCQITALTALGLTVHATRPFIERLRQGHSEGDDCVESLMAYRNEIRRRDALIAALTTNRDLLQAKLDTAASRGFLEGAREKKAAGISAPLYGLPKDLPVPADDGSAEHLPGQHLLSMVLPTSDGTVVNLAEVSAGRWVLFVYPTTGVPGEDMLHGWDEIPGAQLHC